MFNIKLYEKDNSTLIQTLEVKKLVSISTYRAEINGGFGTIRIEFALPVSNEDFTIGNTVHLQFKKNILFIGSIIDESRTYGKDRQTIIIELIGLGALAGTLITDNIYSDLASNIIKDLIDNFNTSYGFNILSYDALSIPDSIGTLSLDFSRHRSYIVAMQEVAETSGISLFIGNDGKVQFKEKTDYGKHTLSIGKEIDTLFIGEMGVDITNELILEYDGGTKTYSDVPSQNEFTKRQKFLDKSIDISNETTADIYGANYLSKFKDKVKKISMTVNNEYNFFDITPGDLISVRNINYDITDLQVVKVTYGLETCKVELEIFYSFSKEIFNS